MTTLAGVTERRGPLAHRHGVTRAGAASGLPVVLGHGFGCDQTMWQRLTPSLATSPLVLFDLLGAGRSDRSAYDPVRHATLTGYADDLVDLLDELALGPVCYVGHSASAMIGVLAAGARPDLFAGLVLVGGSPRYLDDDGYVGGFTRADVDGLLAAMETNYLAWAQALAPRAMAAPDRPELAAELADCFARADSTIAVEFARAIFLSDHRDAVPRVRTPALVVQPADDPMVPAEVGRWLHAALPAGRLVELGARGHFPHVSGPDETAAAIRSFLAEVGRA